MNCKVQTKNVSCRVVRPIRLHAAMAFNNTEWKLYGNRVSLLPAIVITTEGVMHFCRWPFADSTIGDFVSSGPAWPQASISRPPRRSYRSAGHCLGCGSAVPFPSPGRPGIMRRRIVRATTNCLPRQTRLRCLPSNMIRNVICGAMNSWSTGQHVLWRGMTVRRAVRDTHGNMPAVGVWNGSICGAIRRVRSFDPSRAVPCSCTDRCPYALYRSIFACSDSASS